MADLDAEHFGTDFVFWHTMSVHEKIEQAKAALSGWRESVTAYNRLSEHLLGIKVTKKQRELFVAEFVPMPAGQRHLRPSRGATSRPRASRCATSSPAPTCEGVDLTAYGLVQAAIEYGQHVRRANSAESRFKRTFLKRDRLAADAVELATAAASA